MMFESEFTIPIQYKGIEVIAGLRCDFFVEGVIVVDVKACEMLLPIHDAQVLTYMKLLRVSKGILINFNVANLYAEGQKTLVNDLYRTLPLN